MSERYSNVFALPQNLYAVGSPVMIAAGTLLKDNQTGKIVAQLKFRSISDKIIKAVKVKLDLFDTADSPIAEPVVYDYLDLSASRDAEFGQKTPVPIPNNKARSYKVIVTEVVFADKATWSATGEVWEPLSNPVRLPFNDPELLKQYQLLFGSNSKFVPGEEKDLWHCTCGTWNHTGEVCHVCWNYLSALQNVDMAELTAAKEERVAAEEKEKAVEQKKAATKKKKRIAICVIAAVILLSCTIVTQIITSSPAYIAKKTIKEGFEYYQNREFSKAFSTWQKVGQEPAKLGEEKPVIGPVTDTDNRATGYTPTNEELLAYGEDLFYEYAIYVSYISFNRAIPLFEAIPDYKDSADVLEEMKMLLNNYVGEYECISNEYWYETSYGSIRSRESKKLDGNIYVNDFRYDREYTWRYSVEYSTQNTTTLDMWAEYDSFKLKSNGDLERWGFGDYSMRYEQIFSAKENTFTARRTYGSESDGRSVYETIWKKIP